MKHFLVRAVLAACLAALPVSARAGGLAVDDNRPVLVLMSVDAADAISPGQVKSVEELLLSALERTQRFHIIGRSDILTLMDLEARKQLAGCKDDSGCMVAAAGAFGARYVGAASIGRLGTATVLTLRVIDARTAEAFVHSQRTVHADEELVPAIDGIAREAAAAVPVSMWPMPPVRAAGFGATILGGLALVVGTGLAIAASAQTAAAKNNAATSTPLARANAINGLYGGATAGWIGGGVVVAGGIVLWVAF